MILEGFYNLLKSAEPVISLVGTRIHYERQPQGGAIPAIILQSGIATHGHTMTGPAPYAAGFVRINCLASTSTAASDLAKVVRQAINGFKGTAGPLTFMFISVGDETTIPHNVPAGAALPNVHGILLDANFMVNTN